MPRRPSERLPPGQRCIIKGVVAKPELNGQFGTIADFELYGSGRYAVWLYKGGSVALKPANVEAVVDDSRWPSKKLGPAPMRTAATPVTLKELDDVMVNEGQGTWLLSLLKRGDVDPDAQIPMTAFSREVEEALEGFGSSITLLGRVNLMFLTPSDAQNTPTEGLQACRLSSKPFSTVERAQTSEADRLHAAARGGKAGLFVNMKLLLDYGGDVNAVNQEGQTPVHHVVGAECPPALNQTLFESQQLIVLRTLLDTGQYTDIDKRDTAGFSAFSTAVEYGASVNILKLLLERGADINQEVTGDTGFSPIAIACASVLHEASREVTALLIDAKANLDTEWRHPNRPHSTKHTTRGWAELKPTSEFTKELNRRCDFDYESSRALEVGAVTQADIDRLSDLIATGDIDENGASRLLKSRSDSALVDEHELERKGMEVCSMNFLEAWRKATTGGTSNLDGYVPPEPEEGGEYPMDAHRPVFGGRVRIQGLQGAAELNGRTGKIINWNADGKRRFGVQLEGPDQRLLKVKARNLLPEEPERPWKVEVAIADRSSHAARPSLSRP